MFEVNGGQLQLKDNQLSIYSNSNLFELAQRSAVSLAKSTMVPATYNNNVANCMIAMELAFRIGMSPFMVMQNLNIIQGKPSWSATFLIAAINTCGRFEPLRFDASGEGDNYGVIAWTQDKNGIRLESPKVTIAMAKAEGWYQKNGSKWKTMPELMSRYRAASFFSRLYCPEITMGMHTEDEVLDILDEKELKNLQPVRDLLNNESEPIDNLQNLKNKLKLEADKELEEEKSKVKDDLNIYDKIDDLGLE